MIFSNKNSKLAYCTRTIPIMLKYIISIFLVIGVLEKSLAESNKQEIETNIKPSQIQQEAKS